MPLAHPQVGTWPTTQACALTGNRTCGLSVHRSAFNPLSHTSQDIKVVGLVATNTATHLTGLSYSAGYIYTHTSFFLLFPPRTWRAPGQIAILYIPSISSPSAPPETTSGQGALYHFMPIPQQTPRTPCTSCQSQCVTSLKNLPQFLP